MQTLVCRPGAVHIGLDLTHFPLSNYSSLTLSCRGCLQWAEPAGAERRHCQPLGWGQPRFAGPCNPILSKLLLSFCRWLDHTPCVTMLHRCLSLLAVVPHMCSNGLLETT